MPCTLPYTRPEPESAGAELLDDPPGVGPGGGGPPDGGGPPGGGGGAPEGFLPPESEPPDGFLPRRGGFLLLLSESVVELLVASRLCDGLRVLLAPSLVGTFLELLEGEFAADAGWLGGDGADGCCGVLEPLPVPSGRPALCKGGALALPGRLPWAARRVGRDVGEGERLLLLLLYDGRRRLADFLPDNDCRARRSDRTSGFISGLDRRGPEGLRDDDALDDPPERR